MNIKATVGALFLLFIFACKGPVKEAGSTENTSGVHDPSRQAVSQFEDMEGNPVALSDFRGKRILLNYWATWCKPCLEEMPALQRSRDILEKENYIFLLASDQSLATIQTFVAKRGLDFNFIRFKGSLAALQISALPTTIIYNAAGEEVDKIVGGVEWDAPEMIQKLKEIQ